MNSLLQLIALFLVPCCVSVVIIWIILAFLRAMEIKPEPKQPDPIIRVDPPNPNPP